MEHDYDYEAYDHDFEYDYAEEEAEDKYNRYLECWCCYTNGLTTCLNLYLENVCQDCFDVQYKKYTNSRQECTLYNIYRIYQPFTSIVKYNVNCILCDKNKFCYHGVIICGGCKDTLKVATNW